MTSPSLSAIAQKLFEDALQNIIHETVLLQHREHKLLLQDLDPTTKLPHCNTCKLPRLLYPPLAPKVRGATSDPPKDTTYCDKRPWSRIPGHDIYGNPFPKADATGRPPTKKERAEAAKNSGKKDEGTPFSEEANANGGTAPPSPSADGDVSRTNAAEKLEKGEKKANKIDEKLKKGEYVPWHTCPSCKRSLLITRFAKHLEQCMGLSGRQASRNAMAKMNGNTPAGSRGGTPGPGSQGLDGNNDDDGEDGAEGKGAGSAGGVRKKLLKKGLAGKLKKEKSLSAGGSLATNGKIPKSLASKRPPGSNALSSPAPSSATTEKRDRDDEDADEDEVVHVKKRQKLQRMGSLASVTSHATVAPTSAVDMERGESNDGSFVDEGSGAED